jgi:hypothetical protein
VVTALVKSMANTVATVVGVVVIKGRIPSSESARSPSKPGSGWCYRVMVMMLQSHAKKDRLRQIVKFRS